jgi:hypothetical protein
MGERKGAYRVSLKKPEGGRPLRKARCRWEDIIIVDLGEMGWGCNGLD